MILVDGYAAQLATGVPASTLRTWASRGHLRPHGRDTQGRTLYDLEEVQRHRDATGWTPAPTRLAARLDDSTPG